MAIDSRLACRLQNVAGRWSVRRASIADIDGVTSLYLADTNELDEQGIARERINTLLNDTRHIWLVVDGPEGIAGQVVCAIMPETFTADTYLSVFNLYVREEYRQQGVCEALQHAVMTLGSAIDARRVLFVRDADTNDNYWERLGAMLVAREYEVIL